MRCCASRPWWRWHARTMNRPGRSGSDCRLSPRQPLYTAPEQSVLTSDEPFIAASLTKGLSMNARSPFDELAMNSSLWVPLLTKEGSGEVLEWRRSNLPLAPSLVRRGFTRPTHQRQGAGRNLRVSGKTSTYTHPQPLRLSLSKPVLPICRQPHRGKGKPIFALMFPPSASERVTGEVLECIAATRSTRN